MIHSKNNGDSEGIDNPMTTKTHGIGNTIGLYIAWLVAAGMLVSAAVERHPYSFYTLLRCICCPVFAYSAFVAHEKSRQVWVWIFGVLAVLYNPIFRVHLDRSTWIGVNWFTVGVIAVAGIGFWLDKKKSTLQRGTRTP